MTDFQHGAGTVSPQPELLAIRDLSLSIVGTMRGQELVRQVSFEVLPGQMVALIGESGCGKTLTALSILGLLPSSIEVVGGKVEFRGEDLLQKSHADMNRFRGREIGAIFQDPMNSLNPTMSVGDQIAEARVIHLGESPAKARDEAVRLMKSVRIPNAPQRARSFPHEFSGGMQQRVMIAMAIACDPALLVADEPTTALDVTVQAEILDLLKNLQQEHDISVLLVTHDLGVVNEYCERAVVMYAGQVAERSITSRITSAPSHPYTDALLSAVPQGAKPRTDLTVIGGRVPRPGNYSTGCRFGPRCKHFRSGFCDSEPFIESEVAENHVTHCVRSAAGELSHE